jgi:exopolyphosphatase/guanosine-5'-triphosphate,3'-diphosphate pyrophosphatase
MRRAVIDLGTNTFNLLIADTQTHQILFQTKEGVALGMGGINEKRISPDAQARALKTLQQFKVLCDQWEVAQIHAIGTSALRDAQNAADLVQKVADELAIQIEIITGLQEANLIYKGVALTYPFEQPALIMDIGGGSTEFIAADSKGPFVAQSFDIGVSRLFQHFTFQDPYSQEDIQRVEAYLAQHCQPFFEQALPEILIGASGSFETFYELLEGSFFEANGQAQKVNTEHFFKMLDQIIASTQAERDANPHIIAIRKRMAPLAAIKTRWVLQKTQAKQIFISPNSLKEGVLFG